MFNRHRVKTHYTAFALNGKVAGETWTSSPMTEQVEREMYQKLCNEGHYIKVMIRKPNGEYEYIRPCSQT